MHTYGKSYYVVITYQQSTENMVFRMKIMKSYTVEHVISGSAHFTIKRNICMEGSTFRWGKLSKIIIVQQKSKLIIQRSCRVMNFVEILILWRSVKVSFLPLSVCMAHTFFMQLRLNFIKSKKKLLIVGNIGIR